MGCGSSATAAGGTERKYVGPNNDHDVADKHSAPSGPDLQGAASKSENAEEPSVEPIGVIEAPGHEGKDVLATNVSEPTGEDERSTVGAEKLQVPTPISPLRPSSQVSGFGMDEIAEDVEQERQDGVLQELEGIMASMEADLLESERAEKEPTTPQRLDQNDEELMAEILQDLNDVKAS